jgi:hypothetical protein
MYIFYENANIDNDPFDIFFEAAPANTYELRDALYPKIEEVLKTPEGNRKFMRIVEDYFNRNSSKLAAIGPLYMIPFTYDDKGKLFGLFGMTEKDTIEIISGVLKKVNEKANWLFIKNNPVYTLLFFIIRFYTIKKDNKGLNSALAITAMAYYPSIWDKYYSGFQPDPAVMKYTIDNLSQRFIIKKAGTIFNTLTTSIQNSWRFHEKNIINGADSNVIAFIQRIRNDQNSLMKKIKNAYMENKKLNLRVNTSVDAYDDAIVVDTENDTNRVESVTNKIVLNILINGVDLKICDFASNASGVSKIELRNAITQITVEKNSDDMKSFVESILFIYLYDEKHTFEEINSKAFIAFALALFKKSNSKNTNISNIKKKLDKWGTDTGIYGKYGRLATRIDYTKGIFLYFVMCIQKYC